MIDFRCCDLQGLWDAAHARRSPQCDLPRRISRQARTIGVPDVVAHSANVARSQLQPCARLPHHGTATPQGCSRPAPLFHQSASPSNSRHSSHSVSALALRLPSKLRGVPMADLNRSEFFQMDHRTSDTTMWTAYRDARSDCDKRLAHPSDVMLVSLSLYVRLVLCQMNAGFSVI